MAALYQQLDAQYALMQAYAMMSSPVPGAAAHAAPPPTTAPPRSGLASFVLRATPAPTASMSSDGGVASVLATLPPSVAASLRM